MIERALALTLLGSIFLGGCGTARQLFTRKVRPSEIAAESDPTKCPRVEPAERIRKVAIPELDEASGLAMSRTNHGILWSHNDSGDRARLFAITAEGKLAGEFHMRAIEARDWEDIALGPGPEPNRSYLFVGDLGDNTRLRDHVVIYRVPEPRVPNTTAEGLPAITALTAVDPLRLRYPEGSFDAEALLVDPRDGTIYIITKGRDGANHVYRIARPYRTGPMLHTTRVATLRLGLVTAADISSDARVVIVKTYDAAFLWLRGPEEPLARTLTRLPCRIRLTREPQGESLALTPDASGFFTLSEGHHPPLYRYRIHLPGS